MAFIVRSFRQKWRWSEGDRLGDTSWCLLKSSCFKLSALRDMSNCQAIAIATLSDCLKSLAPVFQLMRNRTKTNRTLNTRDLSRAVSKLQVIARKSYWFIALFSLVVIGRSDYLVLVFRRSFQNRSIERVLYQGHWSHIAVTENSQRTLCWLLKYVEPDQGIKLTFFPGSHLAPKYFKVVANSKKLVAMTHTHKTIFTLSLY